MKAIVIDGFGGRETLVVRSMPIPQPDEHEVLIKVKAAGVNPVDWKIREGKLSTRLPHRFPLIPGWDAAGVLEAVGGGVTSFVEGDAVYAYCRKPVVQWGTYAEYIAVPASSVARKPATLSFAEAAAVPLAGLTAYQSLFEAAQVHNGEVLLVQAAAGGVGSYAVQLATRQGVRVIATARGENHDYVLALGASRVIDYTVEDFASVLRAAFPDGIDAVFDLIGGETMYKAMGVLKPGGRLVSLLVPENRIDHKRHEVTGKKHAYVFVRPEARQLEKLSVLIDAGKLRVHLAASFPLEEVARAHEMIESGHTRGKIVVTID